MATLFLPAFVLLCAGLCLSEVISLNSQPRGSITDLSTKVNLRRPHDGYARPATGLDHELDLLDIVLVASVDGNLHALNRTSGSPLWSMSTPAQVNTPSSLKPLVRTTHPEMDPDDEDTQEVYVIEPQTGEIYIMPNKDSPLQRLPLSMAQLVELSPYSISGEDSMKVFVGKKETSLLLVELETGRVKATVNPNAECLWDPFEDFFKPSQDDDDIDLDELDGSKPPRGSQSTEVFIGRTGESHDNNPDAQMANKCAQTTISLSTLDLSTPPFPDHPFKTSPSPPTVLITRTSLYKPCIDGMRMTITSSPFPTGGLWPSRPTSRATSLTLPPALKHCGVERSQIQCMSHIFANADVT